MGTEKNRIISRLVQSQRADMFEMSFDSRAPEGKSHCLQSRGPYFFPAVAALFCHLIEVLFSSPRCALRKAGREARERDIPPMFGASRSERELSFRILGRFS